MKFPNSENLELLNMQRLRPDLNIGENIQFLREQSKLTQDQVVAKMQIMGVDISKSSYAKIETNRMNIKISELLALRSIFQVSIEDFFQKLI